MARGGCASNVGRKGRQGMSLVELIAASSIALLVCGGVLALTQTGGQMYSRADAKLASATEAQRAIDRISEDLRRARGSGLTCQADVLQMTPANLAPVIRYERVTALTSKPTDPLWRLNNLLRSQGGTDVLLTSGITAFQSSCPSQRLVTVGLTAQVGNLGPSSVQTLVSRVEVQNP